MNKIAKALLGSLAVASAFAVTPAAAQLQFGRMDTGLYLGGSVGQSNFRNACDGAPAGVSCDDNDVAWRAFAGWQFNRSVAVEAGFSQLGNLDVAGPGGAGTARARGTDLVGVLSFPVGELFALYGKAGVARMRASGTAPGFSASDTTTDLTYGVGARVNFARNFGARLEWQRFNDVADIKIDYFSIGLLYGFY